MAPVLLGTPVNKRKAWGVVCFSVRAAEPSTLSCLGVSGIDRPCLCASLVLCAGPAHAPFTGPFNLADRKPQDVETPDELWGWDNLAPLPLNIWKSALHESPATRRNGDFGFMESQCVRTLSNSLPVVREKAFWFPVSLCEQGNSRGLHREEIDQEFQRPSLYEKKKQERRRLRLDRAYRLWSWVISHIHLLCTLRRVLHVFAESKSIFLYPKCGRFFD